ncbi:MAG: hypothetical protein Q8N51_02740 [Gammaproteobacteria bacterium]|nr:hypothetical protein [Gammaproteobacteria bacterium]
MRTHTSVSRQHGVALITVMVLLLLSIIAVLAAARTGLLNEALVGNESDYQRALSAAEALLKDAEIDIRGRLPNGRMCQETAPGSDIPLAGFVGCRNPAGGAPYFPRNGDDFDTVRDILRLAPVVPCLQGICLPSSLTSILPPPAVPFLIEDNLNVMAASGLRYGAFSQSPAAALNNPNPILTNNPPPAAFNATLQGWYWVEIFEYDSSSAEHREIQPHGKIPYIYRITAVALGQKVGTRAVVKAFFVPFPRCTLVEPCL